MHRAGLKTAVISLFTKLAQSVGFRRCQDRAFVKLKRTLQEWCPKADRVHDPNHTNHRYRHSALLDDIDTDRIIPARFLRCVSFDGIGEHAFKDDREQHGAHPFDHPHYQEGSILVVGRNFGCGSSREHAPQSLLRWGVQAIVGESFAEIFFGNCTAIGLPCVTADRPALAALATMIEADPPLEINVDLQAKEVRYADTWCRSTLPASAHEALVSGQWDFLSQLLDGKAAIRKTADRSPVCHGQVLSRLEL